MWKKTAPKSEFHLKLSHNIYSFRNTPVKNHYLLPIPFLHFNISAFLSTWRNLWCFLQYCIPQIWTKNATSSHIPSPQIFLCLNSFFTSLYTLPFWAALVVCHKSTQHPDYLLKSENVFTNIKISTEGSGCSGELNQKCVKEKDTELWNWGKRLALIYQCMYVFM